MATRNPKATTSANKFKDPETTPTSPRRPLPGLRVYSNPRTPTRTNSFEEMEVTSLPDPRTPEHSHLDFQHVWNETYLEISLDAVDRFVPELEATLTRAGQHSDFVRFWHMLRDNTFEGTVSMDTLLDEGCKLFGRDAELVQLFNGILPPGGRMDQTPWEEKGPPPSYPVVFMVGVTDADADAAAKIIVPVEASVPEICMRQDVWAATG
ncbi:uncharacterized protein TRAVEDRAFT_50081 [Trametes versicolor FP-101664 SS1]|uniref:uncharacterized protein n=1 Tax=Trametes versicolor (strain FP-101664) TaxID=717944 RepID=UPI0004621C0C|nr:uncharacterized protein TRAVEDRAFT_50081 [Trametes versicolor FP-101664 SS1]EIW55596.1 hypothetical protein TRAVEDRAFT_50081 [Trametes versicolor FP-101664 SS1]